MKNLKASLYGYVVGDAVGFPLKDKKRKDLLKKPVNEMLSLDGYHDIGYWSINSSFVIATLDSIVENEKRINYSDIMRKYIECTHTNKYLSGNKVSKEVDKVITNALNEFKEDKSPTECGSKKYEDNNNKSLSRMLPIVLYCYYRNVEDDDIYNLVKKYSSLTHSHQLSIMACFIYTKFMLAIIKGKDKITAYNIIKCIDYEKYFRKETISEFTRIINNSLYELKIDEIQSTSNVVDTLETVFWVILNTNNYQQAIVGAINLGGDSNTIGGLVGSIAGILYGVDSIPNKWIDSLKKKDLINNIVLNLVMQLY